MVGNLASSGDDKNLRMDRRGTGHADREVVETGPRWLKCEVYTCRKPGSGKGIRQSPVPDPGFEGRRNYALRAQLFHQALADIEVDVSVLDRRRPELYGKDGRRIRALDALILH